MKARVYLRVARDKKRRTTKVMANVKPNHAPIADPSGNLLPTIAFGLDLEIPDKVFEQAEQVIATIQIPDSAAEIAAEVRHYE